MILENAFASIPDMVKALYPQRWLPYHHLGCFAWDKWDAVKALKEAGNHSLLARLRKDVLILVSEHDEIVPREMGEALLEASKTKFAECATESRGRLVVIESALHENAWQKRKWRTVVSSYIEQCTSEQKA